MDDKKQIEIILFRKDGASPRNHSNYVRVAANPLEVTLQFADLKPAPTDAEQAKIRSERKVKVPIDVEMVLPFDVAEALSTALQGQIEKQRAKKK